MIDASRLLLGGEFRQLASFLVGRVRSDSEAFPVGNPHIPRFVVQAVWKWFFRRLLGACLSVCMFVMSVCMYGVDKPLIA